MVTRLMLLIAMTIIFAIMALGYVRGEVLIKNDRGGLIGEYAKKYEDILARDEHVRISGYCASACAMVLGIIPRNHICAEPDAIFAFHSPVTVEGKIDPALTRQFYRQFYPPVIQRRLAMRPPTTDLLTVVATMLVPECKP